MKSFHPDQQQSFDRALDPAKLKFEGYRRRAGVQVVPAHSSKSRNKTTTPRVSASTFPPNLSVGLIPPASICRRLPMRQLLNTTLPYDRLLERYHSSSCPR